MKIEWISVEELTVIHEQVIETTGGVHGLINPGGIESALARPFLTVDKKEMFPSLEEKIAALIEGIIIFHPFIDGNKRTALVAADVCLRLNGYRIIPSVEIETFVWAIARGEKSLKEIAQWLKTNIEPL